MNTLSISFLCPLLCHITRGEVESCVSLPHVERGEVQMCATMLGEMGFFFSDLMDNSERFSVVLSEVFMNIYCKQRKEGNGGNG